MLHHGLVVKRRLHKVGITNSTCLLRGKDEIAQHVFWRSSRVFLTWFLVEFHSLFVDPLYWKGPLPRDMWLVRDSCKLLWHTI